MDFNETSLSTYDFSLFTLLYFIIQLKINLLILLKEPSKEKALLTLHVTTEKHFSQPKLYHVLSCQKVSNVLTFCWTTLLYDLALSCIDKLRDSNRQ